MSWLRDIARPDLRELAPYSHAGWEPGLIRLHANESPWRSAGDDSDAGLNIYPEPHPFAFEARLAAYYGVPPEQLMATRGSDEGIDLLLRGWCAASASSIVHTPPTFGMYAFAARVQGAGVLSVPLQAAQGFALDPERLLAAVAADTRLVFICSPNNPTGNATARATILELARALEGRALLVLDEAYVEFSDQPSLIADLQAHASLAILRTLSKAHALAGARCGVLLANAEIIGLARRIIQPYAVSQPTIEAVQRTLDADAAACAGRIRSIRSERQRLQGALSALAAVRKVWPSDANFLLVQFRDPPDALRRAHAAGILLRDFSHLPDLPGSLRITVGTADQNDRLLECLA